MHSPQLSEPPDGIREDSCPRSGLREFKVFRTPGRPGLRLELDADLMDEEVARFLIAFAATCARRRAQAPAPPPPPPLLRVLRDDE